MKNYSKRGKKVSRGKTRRMKAGGVFWNTPVKTEATAAESSWSWPSWPSWTSKPVPVPVPVQAPAPATATVPALSDQLVQNPLRSSDDKIPTGGGGGKRRKGKSQRKRK